MNIIKNLENLVPQLHSWVLFVNTQEEGFFVTVKDTLLSGTTLSFTNTLLPPSYKDPHDDIWPTQIIQENLSTSRSAITPVDMDISGAIILSTTLPIINFFILSAGILLFIF